MTERRKESTEMALNAHKVDFTSDVNGKRYRLLISEPDGEAPEKGWPVIYLIDGSLHFGIAVDTARIQERWPDTAKAVIVGIAYPTSSISEALEVRNHDLTPPTALEVTQTGWQRHMGATPDSYGGMDAFLQMIEEEVKPRTRQLVRVDDGDQTLMGHSLGGLTTLAALFRTPHAFQQYVAVSPSIWVNDTWILKYVDDFLKEVAAGGVKARLLISTGEFEESDPPFPPLPKINPPMSEEVYRDMMRSCRMVGYPAELADRLRPFTGTGFEMKFVIHPDEDHRSVVPAGIARGVYYTMYRP